METKTDILSIDPGRKGGFAYWRQSKDFLDQIELSKFTTESDFIDYVIRLDLTDLICVMEDVPVFVSPLTKNSDSFKLGYNMGFEMGCVRTLQIPVHLIKPKDWQKGLQGLRPKMGYSDRKRALKDNAVRLFPKLKGITHANCDALLILNYFRDNKILPK
tara:strand:- start:310 stop:789 length:480 start_codon:yes stop_codon:yes gene_type:complete